MKKPKIGAHVSVSGGLFNAVGNAQDIGAECFQIFGSNPRQWEVKSLNKEDVRKYWQLLKGSELGPVFLHAAYLVNLASVKRDLQKKSIKNLSSHLSIAKAIGAQGLIFHPGSAGKDGDRKEALNRVIRGAREVLKNVPGRTQLVVENTSGGGGKLGDSPLDIQKIITRVRSNRMKVCFDTAHAFESGEMDTSTKKKLEESLSRWDESISLENVVAVHANDSITKFGSNNDRHANVGKGCIGRPGFKRIVKDGRLNKAPWILEVPGFDSSGPDKKNIEILKSLF